MANFPVTLPAPTLSGYQGEVGANVLRTDFDGGPARQRLRFTNSPDELNLLWKFKAAEMAIFKAFWETDLHMGTDWFLMHLDIGNGLIEYEVRFVSGKYQYQVLPGMNWAISAKVEVQ